MTRWIFTRIGTNHSSHAENSMRNKFALSELIKWIYRYLAVRSGPFVCVTMISVKSKYGSCSGSCTGHIKD